MSCSSVGPLQLPGSLGQVGSPQDRRWLPPPRPRAPSLRSLPLPGALGAPLSDDSMIAGSSFTGQGASAIVASGGETEAEAVLGRRGGSWGAGGSRTPPPGPLPLTATGLPGAWAKPRVADLEPCPTQVPEAGCPPPRWLLPGLASPSGSRSRLPGPAGPLRAKRGVPALASGRAHPQPPFRRFPLPALSPFFPGYSALGQQPSSPRPPPPRAGPRPHPLRPGGAPSEDLSGTPGNLAWARCGGVLGPAREGAGPQHACFSCPLPRGAPSGPPLFLPFSPICRPLPPLGFLGWKKGPGGGVRGVGGRECWRGNRPHPESCCWAPARRGFKEAEQAPGSQPCPLVPNWKKGAFAGLGRQTLGLGSDPSPVSLPVPIRQGVAQTLPPSNAVFCPTPLPTPTADTPGWSCHMLLLLFLFPEPLGLELPFCSGPLTREGGCLAKPTTGHVCFWGTGGSTEARHFCWGKGQSQGRASGALAHPS